MIDPIYPAPDAADDPRPAGRDVHRVYHQLLWTRRSCSGAAGRKLYPGAVWRQGKGIGAGSALCGPIRQLHQRDRHRAGSGDILPDPPGSAWWDPGTVSHDPFAGHAGGGSYRGGWNPIWHYISHQAVFNLGLYRDHRVVDLCLDPEFLDGHDVPIRLVL